MPQIQRALAIGMSVVAFVAAVALAREEYATLAPFSAVRWNNTVPEVRVGQDWYELVALDDLEGARIVEFCQRTYGDSWQKRFEEDLVEVLAKMGHTPGGTVKLTLRGLDTGTTKLLEGVEMSEANRRLLWRARNEKQGQPDKNVPRVQRQHAQMPPVQFKGLTKRIEVDAPAGKQQLTRQQAEQDLDQLEWQFANRYSYATLRGVDYQGALDAVRSGLGEGISRGEFAIQVAKVLALFGDGHTGLNNLQLPEGYLPFLVGEADGGRLVAFQEDRGGFVDAQRPYLASIDGRPVAEWLEAAKPLRPGGSPQAARRGSIRNLRLLNFLRAELGLPAKDPVDIKVESTDRSDRRTLSLPVAAKRPVYGAWPRGSHRRLDGNIGYLRIESMEDDAKFLDELKQAMLGFRDTNALVIDVRDNAGGARDALCELFGFFMKPDDPPRIVNVAAYRLGQGETPDRKEGYLQNRFLYPITSSQWSAEDRAAIERFTGRFSPEWRPPEGQFSAWHYFLLRPAATAVITTMTARWLC